MIAQDETKNYETCSKLLDEGRYGDALTLAESLTTPEFRAAIYIDAGCALGRSSTVRQGTEIFEHLLSLDQPQQQITRSSLLYNAANGRSALYALRKTRKNTAVPTNDDDLRAAKRLYREALSALENRSGPFASQLLTNYGNCLSQFGRYIEAIEYYEDALNADVSNGMAAGNLGIELEHATWIIGRYRHEYIALAHELLTRALGPDMHLDFGSMPAVQSFQSTLQRLQGFLNAHREPILPPKPVEATGRSRFQREFAEFCIENGLFLNAWVGNRKLSPGITDDISFGPIVTPVVDDYLVPELLRILNEIKESYATARYVYYLSQKPNKVSDAISAMTLYSGTDAFEINGLYAGLCKTAYSRAFDVLDKVARIVNVYFHIGKREDSFWRMFAERQSLGVDHTIRFAARRAICDTENYSLYALADLCIDYFDGEQVDLKVIDRRRNRITHDYLSVGLYGPDEAKDKDNTVGLDDLQGQTRSVLLLAKRAILYAVSAINMAERKREDTTGRVFDFPYFDKPGQPFL